MGGGRAKEHGSPANQRKQISTKGNTKRTRSQGEANINGATTQYTSGVS